MAARPTPSRTPTIPDPFAAGTGNFFQETARVQRLDLLYTLLYYGHSPLLLSAPAGAGKTALLQQLQKRLIALQPTALLTGYPELEVDPLLDEAQRQFTVALTSGGLEGASEAVMLVDDADSLSDVVLHVLLTPASGQGGGQVRVLLAGTPRLVQRVALRLDATAIMPRVLELLPFAAEDSARFVRTRFAAVGIHSHSLLVPEALQRLHRETGGWPGALVTRARAALLTPATQPPPPPSAPTTAGKKNRPSDSFRKGMRRAVRSYWLWPTVGVISVGILFLLWPKRDLPTLPAASLSALAPPPAIHAVTVAPPPPRESLHNAPRVEAPPPSEQTVAVAPVVTPPQVVTAPPPVTPVAHTAPTSSTPNLGPTPPPAAVPVAVPAAPTTAILAPPVPPPPATTSSEPRTNDWLRQQPASDYTLQLMSGNEEEPVREFLHQWGLTGEKLMIAHTYRHGRSWYALLYGVYENAHQAQAAIKQLPHGIGKPWARTLGSIQQDLPPPGAPGK